MKPPPRKKDRILPAIKTCLSYPLAVKIQPKVATVLVSCV